MEGTILPYIYPEDLYRIPDGVTVVIPGSWEQTSEEERTQLSRILQFARLSLDKVRIVATDDLGSVAHTSTVISFGVSSKGLEEYQCYETPGRRTIIADRLSNLTKDVAAKQKLAACLKQAFGL